VPTLTLFFAFGEEICSDFEDAVDSPDILADLVAQVLEELDSRTAKVINSTTTVARVVKNHLNNRRRQVETQSGLAVSFRPGSGMTNQDTSNLAADVAGSRFNISVNGTQCSCNVAIASSVTVPPSLSPSISPTTADPTASPTTSPSQRPNAQGEVPVLHLNFLEPGSIGLNLNPNLQAALAVAIIAEANSRLSGPLSGARIDADNTVVTYGFFRDSDWVATATVAFLPSIRIDTLTLHGGADRRSTCETGGPARKPEVAVSRVASM